MSTYQRVWWGKLWQNVSTIGGTWLVGALAYVQMCIEQKQPIEWRYLLSGLLVVVIIAVRQRLSERSITAAAIPKK